jgi:hypothetical protein
MKLWKPKTVGSAIVTGLGVVSVIVGITPCAVSLSGRGPSGARNARD